ncbi:MAG: Na+/H+ antiporter NhaA, partial [Thermoguttaceae bacterium]
MARHADSPQPLPRFPEQPIRRYLGPLTRFLHVESAGGIVLLSCTIVSLALANSPVGDDFIRLWKTPLGFSFGSWQFIHPLYHWINDGLMAIFFFVIGLEVKRELVLGELRDPRRAALPIAAALGGMVAPAGIYLALQWGQPASRGWGIPMATDIAFVVGCMALLGPRFPHSLRVMLLSLAIVDDIGAILVIAVGYSDSIHVVALGSAAAGVATIVLLARLGVRSVGIYSLLGLLVWFSVHESGIHATIAGVVLGLLTPARSWVNPGLLGSILERAGQILRGDDPGEASHETMVRHLERASREAISPLARLEAALHPWVGFVIMPLFALANACVPVNPSDLTSPVAMAVGAGLLIGKPLGIVAFSYVVVRLGLARMPRGVTWNMIAAGGFLAGIGFTMAMFIAGLAMKGNLASQLDPAKIGILCGSVLAAAIGMG